MRRISRLALATEFVFSFSCPKHAQAIVTFFLFVGDPGYYATPFQDRRWELYLVDSQGDNFGIVSYSVVLTGVDSFPHLAPATTYTDSTHTNPDITAGFSFSRSPNNAVPITASQDITTGSGYLIKGLGQASGNLLASIPHGWDGDTQSTQPAYPTEILIAKGTWTDTWPAFDTSATGKLNTWANVLATNPSPFEIPQTYSSAVNTLADLPFDPILPPEPSTLVMLLATSAILLFRRPCTR